MTCDFHARYALLARDPATQAYAVDFLSGVADAPPDEWSDLSRIDDPAARLEILAQAMASPQKERARAGHLRGKAGGLWKWISSGASRRFLEDRKRSYLDPLGLTPDLPDVSIFPAGAWGMRLPFKLASPYVSRDDAVWHILENPVKKEWVFKVPYVAPSQWKGALRAAIRRTNGWDDDNPALRRLFGESADDQGKAGRLRFFPTFFTDIGLEVINPHSREKGAGQNPILLECVPAGAVGEFVLLNAPFDLMGENEDETRLHTVDDLKLTAEGVAAMLAMYGFGAKTSSGFGAADVHGQGQLVIRYPEKEATMSEPVAPVEPVAVSKFIAEYAEEDFKLKPNEWRTTRNASSRERATFKEAKAQWMDYQKQLDQYRKEMAEWENAKIEPAPRTISRTFTSFENMAQMIQGITGD